MHIVRDEGGKFTSIELTGDEMRELLAFEATCACVIPKTRRAFLEATVRNYRIPAEKAMPLVEKKVLSRGTSPRWRPSAGSGGWRPSSAGTSFSFTSTAAG